LSGRKSSGLRVGEPWEARPDKMIEEREREREIRGEEASQFLKIRITTNTRAKQLPKQ
jgi:hypothetical protein